MSAPFDEIWIRAAASLDVPVVRGGDAYVHFDGRTLHIADDRELDDDDTVAQLVFHEICHAIVQGPENLTRPDWGLDNTTNDDEQREYAAVRLQAHLAGAFGLRGHLFPTTVVRPFFESLPHDALAGGDVSAELARAAAVRAAAIPFGPALREALTDTADMVGAPMHPRSGFPLLSDRDNPRHHRYHCGDCAWRTEGGMCRAAPRRTFVDARLPACTRFEAELDCLTCGACCRSAYDAVEVGRRDIAVKRHPELIVHHDTYSEIRRSGDRCAALEGPAGGPYRCTIYEDRPKTCRDFTRGGRHCIDARRRVGLTV